MHTQTVGARILVSHGLTRPKDPSKPTCSGGTATVTATAPAGFLATCECGWRFAGQHTDGYRPAP